MNPADRKWLCLDCSRNLLEPGGDYFMLQNHLWRELVPRSERHGMLCLACVERRLGRALNPGDFMPRDSTQPAHPLEGPMTLDDYGILDGLRGTELTPVDEFLFNQVRAKPRKIRSIILSALEDPQPELPRVTDLFYTERLEFLLELAKLVVHEEAEDFMDLWVRSKA